MFASRSDTDLIPPSLSSLQAAALLPVYHVLLALVLLHVAAAKLWEHLLSPSRGWGEFYPQFFGGQMSS